MSKNITLPIENLVRELDGKLWLGLNFVERGYDVTLGPSWEIKPTLDIIEPDVYFTKDPGDGNIDFVEKLQKHGTLVYGISPEVNIGSKIEYHITNRMDILNTLNKYFVWGSGQAEALGPVYEDLDNKIEVTGNPRFDLLIEEMRSVYAERGEKIRNEYGDYILINTNFTLGNSTIREKIINNIRRLQPERDPIEEEQLYSQVLYAFLELIIFLASENISQHIIVRPHPNEDHSTYRQAFRHFDQVSVKHEGDVRSWIHDADGVIHYDCTTGIEAAMMSTPTLSYQSVANTKISDSLPQIVSTSADTREKVKQWINESAGADKEHELSQCQKSKIRGYFPNVNKLAAPLICDSVDSAVNDASGCSGYRVNTKRKIERRIKSSSVGENIENTYDFAQDIMSQNDHRKSRMSRRKKFPGISYSKLEARAEQITEKTDITDLRVERIPQTKYTYSLTTKR